MVFSVVNIAATEKTINRKALVTRNNPVITCVDTLASLSVGNGSFAFTTDVTGLQTFPEYYRNGVPLGTQSEWGWHSFGNPEAFRIEESYKLFDFGHGHRELYATEFKEKGRARDAANWYRSNPHRLHLGCIGLEVEGLKPSDIRIQGTRQQICRHHRLPSPARHGEFKGKEPPRQHQPAIPLPHRWTL